MGHRKAVLNEKGEKEAKWKKYVQTYISMNNSNTMRKVIGYHHDSHENFLPKITVFSVNL